jgi:hypothetical protein
MAKEVQTRSGTCPSHGAVDARREIPGSGFPWIVNGVWRWFAQRRPYRCPTCGASVEIG